MSVAGGQLEKVLDAARMAPSWKNLQCWRFLVVRSRPSRERLLAAFPVDNPGYRTIATAPLTIPDSIRVIGMTPLGDPDQEPKARPRKPLADITFYDKWGQA
jgi:nitroreductase